MQTYTLCVTYINAVSFVNFLPQIFQWTERHGCSDGNAESSFDRGKIREGKEKNNLALHCILLINLSWPFLSNTLESQPPLIFEGLIIQILKYGFLHFSNYLLLAALKVFQQEEWEERV